MPRLNARYAYLVAQGTKWFAEVPLIHSDAIVIADGEHIGSVAFLRSRQKE